VLEVVDSAALAPASATSLPSASPASPPSVASETVERPDPGLARGRWEAPAWSFTVVAIAALLGGLAWLAFVLRARKGVR
jgi:hypothetical protein